MGFWSKTFTWWNGATWGTALFTRRFGSEVGRDEAGNVYYQDKKHPEPPLGDLQRRQRRQPGAAGLAGVAARARSTICPDKALPPVRKFQQKPTPNLTGTMAGLPARRRARQRQAAAGLDRRLRALDPRISVRAARRIAADRARARRVRQAAREQQNAPLPPRKAGRVDRSGAGRRDADGAAGRGARHPQQAQRHRPERRASARPVGRAGRT